ncbi:hypothetical protein ABGF48_00835 [Helcococcus bovis]|uniref:hypothetical protein n=1 Tax=Helcococcus bovis TaxID=3153252 RepID=UPI0038BA9771
MNTGDYIKKGSLVTLSAAVLLSQSVVFAEEYKLNNSVQVYSEAINAKNRINSIKTFPKGKYYIFKKDYGMLNISKKENVQGLWINPKDNIELNINNLYEDGNIGEEFVLSEEVLGYMSSDDAVSDKNPVNTVFPAIYKIYNKSKGMINITLDEGQPGTWINPNKTLSSKIETINVDKINLDTKLDGYMNADDANNFENSVTIVEPGSYYIYRSYNGMINVTMIKDEPGVWINPKNVKFENNHSKTAVKSEKVKYENIENQKGDYTLRENTKAYSSLSDAKTQTNSIESLEKGRYYIFELSDGMINLSKNENDSGVWINPKENVNKVKTSNFINESIKIGNSDNKVEDVVEKYIANDVSKKEIKDLGFDYNEVLEKTKEKLSENKNDEVIKVESNSDKNVFLEIDSSNKVKEIYDKQVEAIKEDKQEKNEKNASDKDLQEKSEKNTENSNSEEDSLVNKDNIFSTNRENKTESKSEIKPEEKINEENIEIKITEPKENILDEDQSSDNSGFVKGEKFVLDKETDGYVRAEDALLKVNKVNTLQPGEYIIYKTNSGMINITKVENNLGMWINPK